MSNTTRSLALAAVIGLAPAPMLAIADDDRSTMEQAGDYVSDAMLTTRVNAAFAAESELSVLDISVETTDGVVTLSGEVDTDAQIELAERIASDIDGVQSVHNTLETKDS